MIWVLDHLADLESDFSRFHRIDDIYELDGPRFFRLAWRVSTYGGVMNMRLEQQREAASPVATSSSPSPAVRPAASRGDRRQKQLTAFMAEFPGLIDRQKVG